MTANYNLIDLPITAGIHTVVDDFVGDTTGFADMVNWTVTAAGSLSKRTGFAQYLTTSNISNLGDCDALFKTGSTLRARLKFGYPFVNTVSGSAYTPFYKLRAEVEAWSVVTNQTQPASTVVTDMFTFTDETALYVWLESGTLYAQLINLTSRIPLTDRLSVDAGTTYTTFRVVGVGSSCAVVMSDSGTNTVRISLFNRGTLTFGAASTLVTDRNANDVWDVCDGELGTDFYLAYTSTTPTLKLAKIADVGFGLTNVYTSGALTPVGISVHAVNVAGTGRVLVAYTTGGASSIVAINPTGGGAVVGGPTALLAGVTNNQYITMCRSSQTSTASSRVVVVAQDFANSQTEYREATFDAAAVGSQTTIENMLVASKAYAVNVGPDVKPTVALKVSAGLPAHLVLCQLTNTESGSVFNTGSQQNHQPVAYLIHADTASAEARPGLISGSASGLLGLSGIRKSNVPVDQLSNSYAVEFQAIFWRHDPNPTAPVPVLELSGISLDYSGLPTAVSPLRNGGGEQTPLNYPTITATATGGALSGLLSAGVYNYQVFYFWLDSNGDIHRGMVSPPTAVTTVNTDSVTLTIETPAGTLRQNLWIGVARTEADGAVLHHHLSTRITGTAATYNVIDTRADTTVEIAPLLYTTGGVLESQPMPPLHHACVNKSRIFGINALNRTEILFTKSKEAGVGHEWHNDFRLNLPGSEIGTAIGSVDDKIVVFTRNRLYMFYGDGPDATGAGGFSPIQEITSPVGCSSRSSLLSTPAGLFFQSDAGGIWLLSRDLQVQHIGAPVESFWNLFGRSIQYTTFCSNSQECLFAFSTQDILIFNLSKNMWYRWVPGTVAESTQVAGVYVDGYHYKFNNGSNTIERQAILGQGQSGLDQVYFDATDTIYSQSLTTHWLSLTGKNRQKRFRKLLWLATNIEENSVDIQADLAYDYNSTPGDSIVVHQPGAGTVWQQVVRPTQQNASSLKVSLTMTNSIASQDSSLKMLSLELADIAKPVRLPATQKA